MKHVLLKSLASSALLLFAVSAGAQDRDRDDRRNRDDRYEHQARDQGWWRGRLFERVREDLDHVQAVTPTFSADQYRLVKVKEELNEMQRKYEAHGYDSPEMEDVVATMQRVVSDNHLSGRERDMLSDDLSRLRAFQEHHDGYR